MRIGRFAFLLAFFANAFIPAARAAVYRVSPDAADSSSGANWSEATTLSDALSRAQSGDEVWLKSGVYSFSTSTGVGAVVSTAAKIRGGFSGTESSASERTFADSTVLEGAVTNLLVTVASGLVEIDHITVTGAKGHGLFKEGAASLALSHVHSVSNGIVVKSINVDYSTDGRGGFFTGDAASSELTLDHCVFRGNREWRSGGFDVFNVGGKAKTTGIGLVAKNFRRVCMTDCLMVGNGLREQDRSAGNHASMLSPPGSEQPAQSVFYFENAPVTATRVRFIGNRTGASGIYGGRLTYVKGGVGSSFVDCVWAANDFVCALPSQLTSPSGYNQCGSLVLDLGSQTAEATISGCTFAYNVSGLGWTAGLNVEQGNVTVDGSVFFGNVISSYFGRFADLHVCYRGRCTVTGSVFRGRGGAYFDEGNTRLTIGEGCVYGDPHFATTPQDFISGYVTLGGSAMSLSAASFPFVDKTGTFPTDGYSNGFTFWVANDSNVEAIDFTRGVFEEFVQPEPETPDTSCEWARKTLGVEPVQTHYMPNSYTPSSTIGCQSISGHKVFWFNHTYDPAWGGVYPAQEDRFAVAKPSDGDNPGRPLLVVLHSRGGGKTGADGTISSLGNSDSVAYCPTNFYGLVLDCMGNVGKKSGDHTVLNDFWWGAMPPGTHANGGDVLGMDASYWTFIYGTLMGELFGGPTKEPWKNPMHPGETCLQWLSHGEPPASKRVMDTIEWVVRRYKIDRNRIYLCGNSMGGQGTLGIGLPHGEVFAAIDGNVPATIWYAAKRMGFVDNSGADVSFDDYQPPDSDPPFVLDWSGSDDAWSRDHDVLYRNMARFKFGMVGWWGDYGHCGGKASARAKNDLVEQFPWLEIRKNEAYPVFTAASTDDALPWPQVSWYDTGKVVIEDGIEKVDAGLVPRLGCATNGQINAWFRWNVKADTEESFEIELKIANSEEVSSGQFVRPTVSVVDVTPRRLQAFKPTTGKVRWTYGGYSGVVAKDAKLGVYTITQIPVSQTPTTLTMVAVPTDTPESRVEPEDDPIPPSGGGDDPPTPGKTSIAVPVAVSGLAYTGLVQTGVPEGSGYEVTGNTAVDAGAYEATVTLSDPETMEWSDAGALTRVLPWFIARASNEWTRAAGITAAEWTVGGTAGIVTSPIARFGEAAATLNGAPWNGELPDAKGSYTLQWNVPGSDNWTELSASVSFAIIDAPPVIDGDADVTAADNTFAKYRDGGDLVLVFSNAAATSSFTLGASASGRVLLVGGGGAGGCQGGNGRAGGGGAGGFLEMADVDFAPGTYVVTVGAGGSRVKAGWGEPGAVGGSGGDSSITKGGDCIALAYGGGGGGASGNPGAAGGSGGGCQTGSPGGATQPGSPFGGYGNAGGATSAGTNAGSGGGGAGARGASLSINATQGGAGGEGRSSDITGESVCYAGGGGGAGSTAAGAGGLGGGGSGSAGAYSNGLAGANGLGGGGGGCGGGNNGFWSGKGGSGVVIVRLSFIGGGASETVPRPQVDGVEVEPGELADVARTGMAIVIPEGSNVSVDSATGSVMLDGAVVCTFPAYYTVIVSDAASGGASVVLALNETARPCISNAMFENGKFCMTVPYSIAGLYYSLEYKHMLNDPGWAEVDMPSRQGGDANMVLSVPTQGDSAFYRVTVSDR